LLLTGCGAVFLLPACQTFLPGFGNSSNSGHPFLKPGEDALKAPKNLNHIDTPTLPGQYLLPVFHCVRGALHTVAKAIDNTKPFFLNVADSYPSTIFLLNTK
jgi:hypothetical protein